MTVRSHVPSVPRIAAFGERALLVELDDRFDESLVTWARAIADRWETGLGHGPAVPAYASALLHFDPLRISPAEAEQAAHAIVARGPAHATAGAKPRVTLIPTTYDGPDLADTAERSGLSVEKLISLHAGREYTAYFLGFLPGFAYCGRLDERIVAPRLERPRERVPAGSVAVADGQTAIYPLASPGGWRLIGRTDVAVFDASAAEPNRIRAGDRVRFVPR
ncbi:MAG TPA: carboxyltransferase domain-containing protein [Candidatus Limnocylindria bacterium]|jgi:KipI family sensor histidine kinase inhibitor|nr:carboxyltransferase domain-containing protein [Candidatus Limnocylindria bacterium]